MANAGPSFHACISSGKFHYISSMENEYICMYGIIKYKYGTPE